MRMHTFRCVYDTHGWPCSHLIGSDFGSLSDWHSDWPSQNITEIVTTCIMIPSNTFVSSIKFVLFDLFVPGCQKQCRHFRSR